MSQYPTYQAPPQPQQPRPYNQAFSPHSANGASPNGIMFPPGPPAKRQRLSPDPRSPYSASPTFSHSSLPTPSGPSTPYGFHTPQPLQTPGGNEGMARQGTGLMGPPQRPANRIEKADKQTDINDLSDLIQAAGVDLREEENYLTQSYRNVHGADAATSFNSQTSSTMSPNNSFNQWSSQQSGDQQAWRGSGLASQQPTTEQNVEEELFHRHKKAARALAERGQAHLNNPFLQSQILRQRLGKAAHDNGVMLNVEGLFDRIPQEPRGVNGVAATGPDGTAIVRAKADSLLDANASLVDLLSLISLATNERLRGIAEDAYAVSRGRQAGSHGLVPPDFSDIATGSGPSQPATAIPSHITKSTWEPDSAISPMTVLPRKQLPSSEQTRLPTPPSEKSSPQQSLPTVSFPNILATALISLSTTDRKHEEARLAARRKRKEKRAATERAVAGGATNGETAGDGSPATAAAPLPALPPEVKMTKKERDRIQKAGQTEEVLHRQANQTAALALGGKGKKYSWMSGGTGGGGGGRPSLSSANTTPARLNTSVGGGSTVGGAGSAATGGAAPAAAAGATLDRALQARDSKLGQWREGKGVQIRDLILALEKDGRARRSLVKALARMKGD